MRETAECEGEPDLHPCCGIRAGSVLKDGIYITIETGASEAPSSRRAACAALLPKS